MHRRCSDNMSITASSLCCQRLPVFQTHRGRDGSLAMKHLQPSPTCWLAMCLAGTRTPMSALMLTLALS